LKKKRFLVVLLLLLLMTLMDMHALNLLKRFLCVSSQATLDPEEADLNHNKQK
jgi:hypothetical protein